MFTNYGPYDVQQVELIKRDKQRQLAAIYTPPTFEGVSVRVGVGVREAIIRLDLRAVLTAVRNAFEPALRPLQHLSGRA